MSERSSLIQKRGRVKGSLTRIKAFADSICNETDEEDIKNRLVKLEEAWAEFQEIEDELLVIDDQIFEMEEFETKYFDAKKLLNRALRERNQGQEKAAGSNNFHSTLNQSSLDKGQFQLMSVRLPRLDIPHFSGDYREWSSFKDLFQACVHDNENLSASQKFQYLKGLLKGAAASIVRHLNITDATYYEAWSRLNERFNKRSHIASSYIKLFMEQPSINQSSVRSLRTLSDTFDEVIRGLKGLGKEAERRDAWLIYIGVSKLDYETRELWAQEMSQKDFPCFQDFLDFLNKRCNTLEVCGGMSKRAHQSIRAMHISTASNQNVCPKCKSNHLLHQCTIFRNQPVVRRREFVILNSLCFKCLGANHSVHACRSKIRCGQCKGSHHPLLHETRKVPTQNRYHSPNPTSAHCSEDLGATSQSFVTNDTTINTATINPSSINSTSINHSINPVSAKDTTVTSLSTCVENQVAQDRTAEIAQLPTAMVNVLDYQGRFVPCRVLLDSGSQISLLSESCAQRLKLRRENARLNLTGIREVEVGATRGTMTVNLFPRWSKMGGLRVQAYIMNKLTSLVQPSTVLNSRIEFLKQLQLADPNFNESSEIDIILGAGCVFKVIKGGKLYDSSGELVAQETIFGWVAVDSASCPLNPVRNFHLQAFENIDKTLRRFWEVEEIEQKGELLTDEEERCELHFQRHLTQVGNRYAVGLPFKAEVAHLGESVQGAIKRLYTMEKRFQRDAVFKEQYTNFMREYEELGHMELILTDEIVTKPETAFYLPHHAVFKLTPTPKIRVVFDGSYKTTSGVSLNERLMVGPTIQRDLFAILLNFRSYAIALCADVEKMYRQVLVIPENRDFQRIVWREQPDLPIRHYRLNTVTYGTASAPFLATRALCQIANEFQNKYPEESAIIKSHFYMDDLLSGADTLINALRIKENLQTMLAAKGFNLTKWMSNAPECTASGNETNTAAGLLAIDENMLTTKVLGIQWDPKLDTFLYKLIVPESSELTKRKILSESSRIFDPMGWLAPVTVSVKILLQRLWLCQYDWDDVLPNELVHVWRVIKEQLPLLVSIRIPRCICLERNRLQLHGFCDASERSYAAVMYCRNVVQDKIYTRLIAAKTKVAPLKQISLPRLELNGAFLLSKLIRKILESLEVNLTSNDIYAWTDSTVVLAWLSDTPRKWKTYVANRTSEILTTIPSSQWNHVPSKHNPADPASRGVSPSQILDLDIWWNGPRWLQTEPITPPCKEVRKITFDTTDELKQNSPVASFHQQVSTFTIFDKHSSYAKILRIFSYCARFIHNSRCQPSQRKLKCLTASEYNQAEILCFRVVQQTHFWAEIGNLRRSQAVNSKSTLAALCPFLDSNDVIRVGGRLNYSNYNFDAKHPVILPKDHPFSRLLVSAWHITHLHPGPSTLMGILRQRFWILGLRDIVRKVYHQCMTCFRHRVTRGAQLMAPLPEARMKPTRPFFNVGIDYGGPIQLCARISRGVRPVKGYFALFICLTTRAVHLEAVTDLTAEAFLACLRRFVSRRGIPAQIFCDNATNFVGGRKLLSDLHRFALTSYENPLISSFLSQNRINWNFIPPRAPHFGGIWEAAIKSTKFHLRRVVGDTMLSLEEFSTLLIQIEAILNSRPYAPLSSDPEDLDALTPAHFLIGQPLTTLPEGEYASTKISRLGRWQQIQNMLQGFWKRWRNEYLSALQPRPKWRTKTESLKVGQLVLINEDNTPPTHWLIGRILEVHPGRDKLVRVATIKTKNGICKRAVTKLYKLPIDDSQDKS